MNLMKKALLSIVLLATSVAAALAVPPGSYYNDRGRLQYIVHQNGKEIYHLDKNGNVILTLIVINEELGPDGETVRVTLQTKGMTTQTRMEYWTENGETYLHNGLQKLHRE